MGNSHTTFTFYRSFIVSVSSDTPLWTNTKSCEEQSRKSLALGCKSVLWQAIWASKQLPKHLDLCFIYLPANPFLHMWSTHEDLYSQETSTKDQRLRSSDYHWKLLMHQQKHISYGIFTFKNKNITNKNTLLPSHRNGQTSKHLTTCLDSGYWHEAFMRSPCVLYLCHPPEEIGSLSCRSPKREMFVMYWHSFLCDCTQTETENTNICKMMPCNMFFLFQRSQFPCGYVLNFGWCICCVWFNVWVKCCGRTSLLQASMASWHV